MSAHGFNSKEHRDNTPDLFTVIPDSQSDNLYSPNTHPEDTAALSEALRLAELGYHVLPLRASSKAPWTKHGYMSASADKDEIEKLFAGKEDANLGISTHEGLVVVDVDPRNGGEEGYVELSEVTGGLPVTVTAKTANGGYHYYFKCDQIVKGRCEILSGIDIKACGGYVVAPCSSISSDEKCLWYRWQEDLSPFDREPAVLPDKLLNLIRGGGEFPPLPTKTETSIPTVTSADMNSDKVPIGQRHLTLFEQACRLRGYGFDAEDINTELEDYNEKYCTDSTEIEVSEIKQITTSAAKYTPNRCCGPLRITEPLPCWNPPVSDEKVDLQELLALYEEYMPGIDYRLLVVSLATYIANYLPGSPVWMLLVAPPSSGKTETLNLMDLMPDIYPLDSFTEGGLLPGTPLSKSSTKNIQSPLLSPRGYRLFIIKELSIYMGESTKERKKLESALKRIYDGVYSKNVGVGGGIERRWEGKRGLLAAATTDVYTSRHLIHALDSRLLFYERTPRNFLSEEHSYISLALKEKRRTNLQNAVVSYMLGIRSITETEPSAEILSNIPNLAYLICNCRLRRSGQNYHSPDNPERIKDSLIKLAMSLTIMGLYESLIIDTLVAIAKSSISLSVREILNYLCLTDSATIGPVTKATSFSRSDVKRQVTELVERGILERVDKAGYKVSTSFDIMGRSIEQEQRTVYSIPFRTSKKERTSTDSPSSPISEPLSKNEPDYTLFEDPKSKKTKFYVDTLNRGGS